MMRRLFAVAVLALWLGVTCCTPAQAHVLESDGGVSAVLHIVPDDSPVAGKQTSAGLAFSSSDPGFDINNYAVTVQILRNSSVLTTSQLQADNGSRSDGSANITF